MSVGVGRQRDRILAPNLTWRSWLVATIGSDSVDGLSEDRIMDEVHAAAAASSDDSAKSAKFRSFDIDIDIDIGVDTALRYAHTDH
jgi:hypothetical protein